MLQLDNSAGDLRGTGFCSSLSIRKLVRKYQYQCKDYILLEDSSVGEVTHRNIGHITVSRTHSILKVLFWFVMSIIASLIIAQLQ